MAHILHIQSSPNLHASVSRDLSSDFVARHRAAHPDDVVITRDVVTDPVPHLGVDMLGGLFAKPEALTREQAEAVRLSDILIDEVMAADLIVISAPMYNFSIPSQLKAWIDHIVRAGRTFHYTEQGPQGLITGKRVVLCLASGGVYSEGPAKIYDFQETYLRGVLGFVGLTDVQVVRAEGLKLGPDAAARAVESAKAKLGALAA